MEFRDYLRMLRRGWVVVALITLFCVAAAGAYVKLTPKTFQAAAVILVSVQGSRSVGDVQQGVQFSAAAAKTYADIAGSPVVLGPVITALGLDTTPGELATQVDVDVHEDTSLIQVTASSSSAAGSASIANEVAAETTRVVTRLESSRTLVGERSFVRLRQIQTAEVPVVAVSPNVQRTMALGLIVGLILGFALTILVQSLDTRIREPRALWRLTALPLIGAVPRVRGVDTGSLLVRDDTSGAVGEAFRTLRTNIRFLDTTEQNSLVLAPVRETKGDLNVAANLSWALAEVGDRVVLVDADLRHPQVAEVLKVGNDKGLSDVLGGLVPLAEALHPSSHPKLTVLPAGTLPPNPSELLGSPELATIIASLERQFDHVIIDAPAVLSYSDAAVVAVGARKILVTVATGKTRSADLSAALGRLWNVGVQPLGVVLTQSRPGADPEEFIRPPELLHPRTEAAPPSSRRPPMDQGVR